MKKNIQKKLQNMPKYKKNNAFLESLLLASFPSLGVIVHLISLGWPPILGGLVSGPAVVTAQNIIWSYSCVFLPPVSTAVRTSLLSFVRTLNALLYIP